MKNCQILKLVILLAIKLFVRVHPLRPITALPAGQEVQLNSSLNFVVVEEESDETLFWLELILESNLVKEERLKVLIKEADELTAIFTAAG